MSETEKFNRMGRDWWNPKGGMAALHMINPVRFEYFSKRLGPFKGKKVLDGTLSSIQDEYGSDTIRIRAEKGESVLRRIKGIDNINDFGQLQEIRITGERDTQDIIKDIMSETKVSQFEVSRPSLQDIFIRIARPEKTEVENA